METERGGGETKAERDRLAIKSKRGGNLALLPVQNCRWSGGSCGSGHGELDEVGWNSVGTEKSTIWHV